MVIMHFIWGWPFRAVWRQDWTARCASLWPGPEWSFSRNLFTYCLGVLVSEFPAWFWDFVSFHAHGAVCPTSWCISLLVSGILRTRYVSDHRNVHFFPFPCEQSRKKVDAHLKRSHSRWAINRLPIGHLVQRGRNLCKSQWDHLKIHILLYTSGI